jgi:hypothetical protein
MEQPTTTIATYSAAPRGTYSSYTDKPNTTCASYSEKPTTSYAACTEKPSTTYATYNCKPSTYATYTNSTNNYGDDYKKEEPMQDTFWLKHQVKTYCKKQYDCGSNVHMYLVAKVCEKAKDDCNVKKVATLLPRTNTTVLYASLNGKAWTQESQDMSLGAYKSKYGCFKDWTRPTCSVDSVANTIEMYTVKKYCVRYVDQYDCSYYADKKVSKYCYKTECSPCTYAYEKCFLVRHSLDPLVRRPDQVQLYVNLCAQTKT